jgi:hypothetical protein
MLYMNKENAFLFCGLIYQENMYEKAIKRLSDEIGKVILCSEVVDFNFTNYYKEEMGENLLRKWVLFDYRIKPEKIGDIKHKTILIEKDFMINGKRKINIDPGYITLSKVVLPTTKNYAHRLYLGDDVFAEITLIYAKGQWQPLRWTYRDYRTGTAIKFFEESRKHIVSKKR